MSDMYFDVILWDGKNPQTVEHCNLEQAVSEGAIEFHPLRGVDESVVVRQYTGLKDKNGTLIYEGDIIDWGDNFDSVVVWDDTEHAWGIEELGVIDGERAPRNHNLTAYTYVPTVIGNIYENPELYVPEHERHGIGITLEGDN